ncbi:MAG TPA: competence/damage-inducible protein A [Saprospiraceae bacterium]|nr:competence/damage-inducible protein A [Saprospiraceae bacterium]
MKAYIITIGDELLIGQVTDTNSGWIAQALAPIGVETVGKMTVGDGAEDIKKGLDFAANLADIVILTGGLGPTKDDLTVSVLADYFGAELVFNDDAFAKMKAKLTQYQVEVSDSHRRQSFLPKSAILLDNALGTAPGMWFERNNRIFVAIPGVPREMKSIMREEIIPKLLAKAGDRHILHKTFLVAGIPESSLSERLEKMEGQMPDFLSLAYLPKLGTIRLRISGEHDDALVLAQAIDSVAEKIRQEIGSLLVAEEDINFAQAIGQLLVAQKATLATAESCTGGHIAHLITVNSGASAYFKGTVVAYANEVKENILGVQSKTLEKYGAVSRATAEEMANGVRKALGTDYGVATTGIAGPTGGTPDKPVGTIWIAAASKDKTVAKKLQLGENRLTNIEFSSVLALNLLRKVFLVKKET